MSPLRLFWGMASAVTGDQSSQPHMTHDRGASRNAVFCAACGAGISEKKNPINPDATCEWRCVENDTGNCKTGSIQQKKIEM